MDEEIDTRKIDNSFLRDHNYATEGTSNHMISFSQVHVESDILKELFGNAPLKGWALISQPDKLISFYSVYLFIFGKTK